jgi:hypothetical protein
LRRPPESAIANRTRLGGDGAWLIEPFWEVLSPWVADRMVLVRSAGWVDDEK